MKVFFGGRTVQIGSGLIGMTILMLGYSNCSDVSVMQKPMEMSSYTTIARNEICAAGEKLSLLDEFNAVFIVDMSRSNIGTFTPNKKNVYDVSYTFDKSKGTDTEGRRFDALLSFLESHKNARYKILPFSSVTTFTGYPQYNCSTAFVNATEAIAQVNALKAWQTAEIALYENNTSDYRIITARSQMNQTDYNKALDCGKTAMTNEIVSLNAEKLLESNYKLFYVTDGKPKPPDPITQEAIDSLAQKVKNIAIDSSIAASFQIVPIFYGQYDAADEALAMQVLESMGKAGGWFNPQNPTRPHAPLRLNDVNDINFNKIYMSIVLEPSRIIEFNVINLTTRLTKEGLLIDSDMDGIPDNTDTRTASDIEYLVDAQSFDKDLDLIPDFLEPLFGLSTSLNDAKLDNDNDGMSNLDEIHVGRSPSSPEKQINPKDLVQWSRSINSNQCAPGQETWNLDITNLPLLRVDAFQAPPTWKFNLSHDKNENVFIAYYITQPETFNSDKRILWAYTFKINFEAPQSPIFKPQLFKKIAEMKIPEGGQ